MPEQRDYSSVSPSAKSLLLMKVYTNIPCAKEAAFVTQHNIEQNKFVNYETARQFFEQQGFEIVEEAEPDYKSLSVIPHLVKVMPEEVKNSRDGPPKIQATWMLKAK